MPITPELAAMVLYLLCPVPKQINKDTVTVVTLGAMALWVPLWGGKQGAG